MGLLILINMFLSQNRVARSMMMAQQNIRFFGVTPKLPKVELTCRTPYQTLFENFSGFTRLYVGTIKGQMSIGNKSIPRVYLLPPGEMKVQGITEGNFMHTGGWLFVHDNNSIEVNLLECEQKESVDFEKLTGETSEPDSNAGKIAAQLQDKTYKIF